MSTGRMPVPLCDICRNPGACCRSFGLTRSSGEPLALWDSQDKDEQLSAHGLPSFHVIDTISTHIDETSGQNYSVHRYGCSLLQPDGRCGDYANRPQLCRSYVAGSDGICAMFIGARAA